MIDAPSFSPCDPATWPATLTLEQVAAIYQRSALAIRHALKPSSKRVFTPVPYQRHPMRWRKVDVERDVSGARQSLRTTTEATRRSRTA